MIENDGQLRHQGGRVTPRDLLLEQATALMEHTSRILRDHERQFGQVRGIILQAVEEQGITAHERKTLATIADILHISLEASS